tara:strand:+ start:153 stop:470 length:318 start_codon:yes stop_codon:yes gene_type:complete
MIDRYNPEYKEGSVLLQGIIGGLSALGAIRLTIILATTAFQLAGGRPLHERFYDHKNGLSYCSGPEEIIDISRDRKYTIIREEIRNPWDNLDYKLKTDNLILKEK